LVHWVRIGEVDCSVSWGFISEYLHEAIELLEDLVSIGGLKILVVVSLIVIAPILLPVISDDVLD
jgi:hypothetical protein